MIQGRQSRNGRLLLSGVNCNCIKATEACAELFQSRHGLCARTPQSAGFSLRDFCAVVLGFGLPGWICFLYHPFSLIRPRGGLHFRSNVFSSHVSHPHLVLLRTLFRLSAVASCTKLTSKVGMVVSCSHESPVSQPNREKFTSTQILVRMLPLTSQVRTEAKIVKSRDNSKRSTSAYDPIRVFHLQNSYGTGGRSSWQWDPPRSAHKRQY